jgi:hypothetical protein
MAGHDPPSSLIFRYPLCGPSVAGPQRPGFFMYKVVKIFDYLFFTFNYGEFATITGNVIYSPISFTSLIKKFSNCCLSGS